MEITVECVNDKQPHGEHEFQFECPRETVFLLQIRGFESVSDVTCPVCGEEQDLNRGDLVSAFRGQSGKVKKTKTKKPKKTKAQRAVDPPDPALEKGFTPRPPEE